jgi:hypothetical protein
MATDWMRSAARGAALATCILLPLCGCATTPPTFDNGWVFESRESPSGVSKPTPPAPASRSESAGDSAANPVQQVGSVDPPIIFSGPARRSESVR